MPTAKPSGKVNLSLCVLGVILLAVWAYASGPIRPTNAVSLTAGSVTVTKPAGSSGQLPINTAPSGASVSSTGQVVPDQGYGSSSVPGSTPASPPSTSLQPAICYEATGGDASPYYVHCPPRCTDAAGQGQYCYCQGNNLEMACTNPDKPIPL